VADANYSCVVKISRSPAQHAENVGADRTLYATPGLVLNQGKGFSTRAHCGHQVPIKGEALSDLCDTASET